MDIVEYATDSGHRFVLTGRLDAYQVPRFKVHLERATGDIVLDFSGVVFIDSTGLASLVSLYKRTEREGRGLRIVELQDQVRGIFEITQLHTLLPLDLE